MLSSIVADSQHGRTATAHPQPQPLMGDSSTANGSDGQQQQSSSARASIRSNIKRKSGSPTFTKFLSSLLLKALGGNGGAKSPTLKRQSGAPAIPALPAYQHHPPRASSSSAAAAHGYAPPQYMPVESAPPPVQPQPPLATESLSHLAPTSLPALFASAAQAFDTAATRLIACDEPLPSATDPYVPSDPPSTRLWHTLALHLRSTFPPTHRHLLQPVLSPVDLVPYLASLLAELALDVCQTLVPGGPLAADQAAALRVFTDLATDEHVRETLQALVTDLLLTLAAIHPSPLPVDNDDRAALYMACREATRALAGMRAVHPMLELSVPAAHAPVPVDETSVQWIGTDVARDVRPGGRKVVSEANLVAYVVFPGVSVPSGVDLQGLEVPRAAVGAYHDPRAYLAGRKRDLYAAAMAAKSAAAIADADQQVSDLEKAMMAHWHHLQVECEDQNELDRQRRRADEELILANAYGAQMTLYMADGIVDG